MPGQVSRAFSFDVGIEQVIVSDVPLTPQLPAFGQVLPTDAGYETRLTEVLFPKSLEQQLLDELRPELSQRDMLNPAAYGDMVQQARQELQDLVGLSSPADADWNKALAVLNEEQSLRELLSTYRHLLHRA